MITEHLYADENAAAAIERAVALLCDGKLVAVPTETVYGLAARADDPEAIKKIFSAKGRPQDNPLIVHISDMEMLPLVAEDIPPEVSICAERFWPGPFTLILRRGKNIAPEVSAGLDTVAVRMPSDEIVREIIRSAGPLAAPSANTSGKPSPTNAARVIEDLDGKIDAVVIGSDCAVGVESTVLSLVTDPPRLLRPGGITEEQLREIFPRLVIDSAVLTQLGADERAASPGMKYKHYAPETKTYLVEGSSEAYVKYVNERYDRIAVCFDEEFSSVDGKKLSYGSISDGNAHAHKIFEVLRRVDELESAEAYVHAPPKDGIGLAVYNRLLRAAAFRVIKL